MLALSICHTADRAASRHWRRVRVTAGNAGSPAGVATSEREGASK